jgi:hypothetical protein
MQEVILAGLLKQHEKEERRKWWLRAAFYTLMFSMLVLFIIYGNPDPNDLESCVGLSWIVRWVTGVQCDQISYK